MHILFVDDSPEIKVLPSIEYLQRTNLDFSYEISKSVNSALLYFHKHSDEIDLVVLDLGLPMLDDGYDYDKLHGLVVLETILSKKNVPIIINSTTELPNEKEYLQQNFEGHLIQHVKELDCEWLSYFIQQL